MKAIFAIAIISLIVASQAFLFAPSLPKYDLSKIHDVPRIKARSKTRISKAALDDFIAGTLNFFRIRGKSDSIKCFDEKTAISYLQYYYSWAASVSASAPSGVLKNSSEFFNGIGKKLEARIPASVTDCVQQSDDTKKLNKAIGKTIFDQQFVNAMNRFIKTNPSLYVFIWNNIWDSFQAGDHADAGNWFGSFYSIVASHWREANTKK